METRILYTEEEKNLMKNGYEREFAVFNIQEYDPHPGGTEGTMHPFRRLSYDLGRDFSDSQLHALQQVSQEINKRFPNIKMFITGTGWQQVYPKDQAECNEDDLANE